MQDVAGQDPWVVPFDGSFLLVFSDADARIVVRRCPSLDDLGSGPATIVWDPAGRGDHALELWAPELHHLDGGWFLYFAASDGRNRNRRSYVLQADHPLGPYRERGRIADRAADRWAIDLTVAELGGRRIAVWSGWKGRGLAGDEAQQLYLAPMATPWSLAGPHVEISRADRPWERSVAPINEGPQLLHRPDGGAFLVYSADASWTTAYKLGALEWTGDDPASPASWHKLPEPLLVGGGHGCFVEVDGRTELVLHRKTVDEPGWSDRVLDRRLVEWEADGRPRFSPVWP